MITAAEKSILERVVRGEIYWGRYTPAFGIRAREAARNLADMGLCRVVTFDESDSYVAIPPNAEWDFKAHDIRIKAAAVSAQP